MTSSRTTSAPSTRQRSEKEQVNEPIDLDLRRVSKVARKPARGLISDIDQLYQLASSALGDGGLPDESWSSTMASILVDATITGDSAALHHGLETLRHVSATLRESKSGGEGEEIRGHIRLLGAIEALAAVTHWGARRTVPRAFAAALEPRSHAAQILSFITSHEGVTNRKLSHELKLSESEVSRTGRRLTELGMAIPKKIGRANAWFVTPRGKAAFEAMRRRADFSDESVPEVHSLTELVELVAREKPSLVRVLTPAGVGLVYERHSIEDDCPEMAKEDVDPAIEATVLYAPTGTTA
ncbi:hypothetical protein ABZS94_26085 [Streptomyces sp. NPDC005500]|uniref:hypothetical protein n=1 Tax=Streptomyces sp. NPDC005500 TaxID=3155007 RepID=UPI0033A871AB